MLSATPGRPQPQPSLGSMQWWKSGADGQLHMSQCQSCQMYLHPPLPMCPTCRSTEIELVPVSGKATVVGVSVNHQQWLPEFPVPYVIAIVAMAEDDRARLTTNIVNVDPDDVVLGLRVRVVFEQGDRYAIPMFEPDPDGAGDLGPMPEPNDYRKNLRAMPTPNKFEDTVAITGVGQSKVGRRLMVDPVSLTVEAVKNAVADAGLTLDDIDGMSTYPGAGMGGMTEGGIAVVEEALGLKPTWVNAGAEVPGQNGSIMTAMLAVSAGLCRHVICYRTMWQASESAMLRSGEIIPPAGPIGGMLEWRAPWGAMSAASWIGMHASHYFNRYGGDREVLGHIAVETRRHAGRNPEALYRDPITMDDYYNARMVTTPFGLYDCDVPCDGAIAVVVSALETTKDLAKEPVLVEAVGTQVLERLSWDQETLTHMPQALGPSAHLWTRTSLTPDDVDAAMLYDGFTFNALSWLEGLGFCEFGEASDYIGDGSTIALGGRLPLNPHGGQLSAGRLHGYGFVREAVLQIRGEAAGRQVDNCRVVVASAGGGVPSGVMLLRKAE